MKKKSQNQMKEPGLNNERDQVEFDNKKKERRMVVKITNKSDLKRHKTFFYTFKHAEAASKICAMRIKKCITLN